MILSSTLIFSFFLLIFQFALKYVQNIYALDQPDSRKLHSQPISQIGGLTFASFFLFLCYLFNLVPIWFIVGGLASIAIGVIDDNFDISWKIKLIVQIFLAAYLSYIFWGRFDQISFYNESISIDQSILFLIFLIWFVGIYNAVNLIDGLDGLAAGFIVLFTIPFALFNQGVFASINYLLLIILLGFLVFNQRPAKVFMGDAGSLFLGFFVAVIPLLYMDLAMPNSNNLNMTSFVLLVTYLIADTSRVFFSRVLSGKSPMTADTIHFHHLVIQGCKSYLATLFMIFLFTGVSAFFAILNNYNHFYQNGILIHLTLIFLFVLSPVVPTGVNLINRLVKPTYIWNKKSSENHPKGYHLLLIIILFCVLIFSLAFTFDSNQIAIWELVFSFILLSIFIFINYNKIIIIPVIQIYLSLLIFEWHWMVELSLTSKLFTLLTLITFLYFTLNNLNGTQVNQYSALDLLIIIINVFSLLLLFQGIVLNYWIISTVFTIWFATGFILRRFIYINTDID